MIQEHLTFFNCAFCRTFAPSGEALAIDGLKNLKAIAAEIGE